MSNNQMSSAQKARITNGVASLQKFAATAKAKGLSNLSHDELLTLRSVESLIMRLEAGLREPAVLGPALLSAADVWAVRDLATANPADSETLLGLQHELEGLSHTR